MCFKALEQQSQKQDETKAVWFKKGGKFRLTRRPLEIPLWHYQRQDACGVVGQRWHYLPTAHWQLCSQRKGCLPLLTSANQSAQVHLSFVKA